MTDQLYLIELILPDSAKDSFMDGLELFADSMACFEYGSEEIWQLQIYTQEYPDEDELKGAIELLSLENSINNPSYTISEVEETDWVAESQKNFEPVRAGRFFIYPSWRRGEIPEGCEGIEIDPQRAFGTGGHETTKGCILAMQKLGGDFKNMLDMGCGSGILAIAMAKIWPNAKITAADYDPVSVEISEVNAGINNVNFNICESDGYSAKMVKNSAPYDLIASNILAAPLIQFAPDAAAVLAKGGYLILAGLLVKQADEVLAAHTANGLKLVDRVDYGDWAVLVLRK